MAEALNRIRRLKILKIHNRYREAGGEDESVRAETLLLQERGQDVSTFSCDNHSVRGGLIGLADSVWNRRIYSELRDLIRRERPDVVHVHNTFHAASPSVHWAAHAEGVAVVQTLHNYRLLCCNALLFREGAPCNSCVGKSIPWPGVVRSCYRGGVAPSLAVTAVTAIHRSIGTWRERIDLYIAPSEFTRAQFVAAGFPPEKVLVKPNFVHPDPGVGPGDGGFALFAGRLSFEKGLGTLLDAWQQLDDIPLRIVGDGPLRPDVVAAASSRRQIEWLGRRSEADVCELMGRARCVVVPSECYETFGRVAAEALAKGTPVVVSDAGAPANLVIDGDTGFHFRSRDAVDLARAVRAAFAEDLDVAGMRSRARRAYESKYSGAVNYEMLMAIYERAVSSRSRGGRGEAREEKSPNERARSYADPTAGTQSGAATYCTTAEKPPMPWRHPTFRTTARGSG